MPSSITWSRIPVSPWTLTVTDAKGKLFAAFRAVIGHRRLTLERLDIPAYWVKPEDGLSSSLGAHRYVWDLHFRDEHGPLVPPGNYFVALSGELRVGLHQGLLRVRRDPRVQATDADLQAQYILARKVLDETDKVHAASARVEKLLTARAKDWPGAKFANLKSILGGGRRRNATGLQAIAAQLERIEGAIESAPAAPTKQEREAFEQAKRQAEAALLDLKSISK